MADADPRAGVPELGEGIPRLAAEVEWLVPVAEAASEDSGGVPADLLGDYLLLLADAAGYGRIASREELEAVEQLGRRAAHAGVTAGQGVSLYLSAARRVWRELPAVVRSRDSEAVRTAADAVLRVVEDAVAAFAEGHATAGREMLRREEALRRDLVDDLLRGDAHLGELVARAEPFGLDLTRSHQVALAAPGRRLPDVDPAITALERVVLDRFGDRDLLVAYKEGALVVVAPAAVAPPSPGRSAVSATRDLGQLIHDELNRLRGGRPWRVATGRGAPRCLRHRPLLRGGSGGPHHGGADTPRQRCRQSR